MKMLDPIYPEEIEKIKAKFEAMINAQTNESMKDVFRVQCDVAVAGEIGRQRQAAIDQGGELGERIKAENEAAMKALKEEMKNTNPELLEQIRKAENEKEKSQNGMTICPNCKTAVRNAKFCTECGYKLAL